MPRSARVAEALQQQQAEQEQRQVDDARDSERSAPRSGERRGSAGTIKPQLLLCGYYFTVVYIWQVGRCKRQQEQLGRSYCSSCHRNQKVR
jgi:hypothetical protein